MSELMVANLFVFVLALFVGIEIIHKVPQMLHTPLMSGSNAISGITVAGAIALAALSIDATSTFSRVVALLAIVFATVNVVGGFLVTDRMLRMFKRR